MSARKGKRLNPFQHALIRPENYIGSIATRDETMWTYDFETKTIVQADTKFNPGLYTIIREIVSNSIDNKWVSDVEGYEMTYIHFEVDPESGFITITNDGFPISAEHESYDYTDPVTQEVTTSEMYAAELYFGYMLAGTNYNDSEKRLTSGRNGIGSKATNVFSKVFEVEHVDPNSHKIFYQQYRNNLTERDPPKVKSCQRKTGYTKIRFKPDYKRFVYPKLDLDLQSLICKLAQDTAMITALKVKYNEVNIKIPNLMAYAKLYYPKLTKKNCISFGEDANECVLVQMPIPSDAIESEEITNISFINGINTKDGGIHVKSWRDGIFSKLLRQYNSKLPKGVSKASQKNMYPFFALFVRCEFENPEFESQVKNQFLSVKDPESGKSFTQIELPEIPEESIKEIMKWDFVKQLKDRIAVIKDLKLLEKPISGKRKFKNLVDANDAGTKYSDQCTLVVVEGDSAKTFATSGFNQQTDKWGIARLRGKLINPRGKPIKQVADNEEIQMLKYATGVLPNIDYRLPENRKKLRYGKICCLTDADADGIHIEGLVWNFFEWYNPTVLQTDLCCAMRTKIVQAGKLSFYSVSEYKEWAKNNTKNITAKYYKGLGSSSAEEARAEFKNPKIVCYDHDKSTKSMIELAFANTNKKENKHLKEARKEWITKHLKDPRKEKVNINTSVEDLLEFVYQGNMTFSKFIENHLPVFTDTALTRAIPNVYDGLKEAQRKILYGCFKKNWSKSPTSKLPQLGGYISEHASYHHGEAALYGTIIKMAQRFVGKNNIPYLYDEGQFGTRLSGGDDAASARYISTRLETITRAIFPIADDPLLPRVTEDGMEVEPVNYVPILPMILVNGADGIATGVSTKIPCYNPLVLSEYIKCLLRGEDPPNLVPWYRGFNGKLDLDDRGTKWTSTGILENMGGNKWKISELPIGTWTDDMKDFLEGMANDGYIKKLKNYCSDVIVDFQFESKPHYTPDVDEKKNMGSMMKRGGNLTNMTVLLEGGYPIKCQTPQEIIDIYFPVRLALYGARRRHLLNSMKFEIQLKNNKYKFIKGEISGKISLTQDDAEWTKDLEEFGLEKLVVGKDEKEPSFKYLLNMPIKSKTNKNLEKLKRDKDLINQERKILKGKRPEDLWLEDLAVFEEEYHKFVASEIKRGPEQARKKKGSAPRKGGKAKK